MIIFKSLFSIKIIDNPILTRLRKVLHLFIILSIMILFIKIAPAGEREDFESAQTVFNSDNQKAARILLKEFIKKYPNSPNYSTALAYDIIYDYILKDYDSFEKRIEEFRNQYPNHRLMHTLDYYKGRNLRRRGELEEAKAFFLEFIEKYKDSPHRKFAEEITGPSQVELSHVMDAYWKKDYERARVMISDFITSYPAHSRADQLLYRKADSLYMMKRYDQYLKESEALLKENPNRKYAYMLIYLQSAVFIKRGDGEEARKKLDLLENQFTHSQFYKKENIDQMRLESYLYEKNFKNLASVEDEWPIIENLLDTCTIQAIQLEKNNWFTKNLNMAEDYYKKTDQTEKQIAFYKGLHDEFSSSKWSFQLKEKILETLIDRKIYSEAQTLGKLYLSEDSLDQNQKRKLSKIIIRAYVIDEKVDEAVKIYEQYGDSK